MKRMLLLLFALIFFLSTAPSARAQIPTPAPTGASLCDAWFLSPIECMKPALMKAVSGALNKQGGDVGTASFSMAQMIISLMGLCDAQCDPSCPRSLSFQGSALAGLQTTVLAMYEHPPVDTRLFLADIGKTLGFAPRVSAQGIGFSGLTPLLPLWKAFRNIAYALLASIMIIVGFMVMFRKKIDPKTVVTVQNAIPRIVIALLLVTFSYAIAGVMIDLMYFAIMLAVSVISGSSQELGNVVSLWSGSATSCTTTTAGTIKFAVEAPTNAPQLVTRDLVTGGVWGTLKFFFGSGFQSFDDLVRLLTGNLNPITTALWVGIPGLIGGALGGFKGITMGLVSAPLALVLILLIVLIFGFVRLVFMLIDAYINIIIALLISPFQLMMEAVPGTNAFASWSKNLLSKILVFPITAVLLMVSAILTSQDVSSSIWAPPLISTGSGGFGMAGIIGLGMLLVIPGVVAGFQKALKAEPVLPGGVGTILGPVGSGVGQLWNLWYQASFIGSAMRHKPDARTPFQAAKEGTEKGLGSITGGGAH